MNVLVAAPFCRPCFVLRTEEVSVVTSLSEKLRQVPLIGVEVIGETRVGEPHDTVSMWIAACPQCCS